MLIAFFFTQQTFVQGITLSCRRMYKPIMIKSRMPRPSRFHTPYLEMPARRG